MPILLEEAGWIWKAFETLSEQRKWTDSGKPQPIEMGEILAYATYHGIDDEDRRDDLLRALSAMDGLWREAVLKKIVTRNRQRPPTPKRHAR